MAGRAEDEEIWESLVKACLSFFKYIFGLLIVGPRWFGKTGKCFDGIDFVDTFPLEKILGCLSLKRFFAVFFRAVFVVRVKNPESGSLAMLDQLITVF